MDERVQSTAEVYEQSRCSKKSKYTYRLDSRVVDHYEHRDCNHDKQFVIKLLYNCVIIPVK